MRKGAIYSCIVISGGGEEIDQGDFEIIQLTNKTCKLQHIREGFYNSCGRFYGRDKDKKTIETITMRTSGSMKEFIQKEFVKYDTGSGTPYIFTLKE